ncbi:S9 family peptidase [bacterium]|nr:S9 family peptidase [bacterium]
MASAKSATRQPIEVETLTKFHIAGDPQISPNGQHVMFVRQYVGDRNDYVRNLWRTNVAGKVALQFTSGDSDSHPRWSPAGDCIAFISGRNDEAQNLFVIAADGGEAVQLTHFPEGSISSFQWSPDGRRIEVAFRPREQQWTKAAAEERKQTGASTPPLVIDNMFYRMDGDGYFNAQRFGIYSVDAATGDHTPLFTKDKSGWLGFSFHPNGSQLVVTANADKEPHLKSWKYELFKVDVKSGRSTKIPNLPIGAKSAAVWSPDGKWIAWAGQTEKAIWGSRNTRLFVCRPDGSQLKCLTQDTDYCLTAAALSDTADASFEANLQWSHDSKRIYFALGTKGARHIASADLKGDVSVHTTGRKTIEFGNMSADGRVVAATLGSIVTPADVGTLELPGTIGKLKFNRLTKLNDELLRSINVAESQSTFVTAEDGWKVHTWIMKPPGFKSGKRYPAILQIHGGPHAMYGEAFFHEFQCLAAAGYVVIFSNPRGSKGYGEQHCDCIRGDWGNKDWLDIQAVANHMKDLPYVDPKRIGIMGGSYGGYMTNWAIGHTNQFAVAITDRCVSNLVSMAGSGDIPLVPGNYWDGNAWDKSTDLWTQSPIRYFANVKTPTLVIHSEGDLRCNVEQGEQVFSALKTLGVPTRFVRYPQSTSHGLSRSGPPDLRMHRLRQIVQWLDAYLQ